MEAYLLFLHTAHDLFDVLHAYMAEFGLSDGKMGILLQLCHVPERFLTPSALADNLGITRGTVTGLLDGLERDGLVERVAHPEDRRMLMIRLTDKGFDLLERMLPAHFRRIDGIMGSLTMDEKEQMISLLEKMHSALYMLNYV